MCGRYVITSPPEALRRLFNYGEQPNFPPHFNIAPTQPVPVVIREHGTRHFRLMRWGFLPAWVKDPRTFALVINARSETVLEKPSFRAAMRRRRCLLPADGYYEWQAGVGRKRPFFIRRRDGQPIGFAGLFETWAGPNGEELDTVAIITAAAPSEMAVLHDRVPVTIDPQDFEAWLDTDVTDAAAAARLLAAPLPGTFAWHEVSTAVNRVANDGPHLIQPLSPEEIAAADAADVRPKDAARSPRARKALPKPAGEQGELF